MSEVLAGGSPEQRLPGPRRAGLVGLAALSVLAAGLAALPGARDRATPPVVEAQPTGISTSGGRLRVWLALQGPAQARLLGVEGRLPGSTVEADGLTARFSRRGSAAVRLQVRPRCPGAVQGLEDAVLRVALDDGVPATVEVPFSTEGLLAEAVRARCVPTPGQAGSASQPVVRSHRPGPQGSVQLVLRVSAAGGEEQRVRALLPAPGLTARTGVPLPLRVRVDEVHDLVVDLRAPGCGPLPEGPLLRLDYERFGLVVPRVDAGVRTRLQARRDAACAAAPAPP